MVIKTWQNMAKHGKTWEMGNYETDWTISHEQKKLTLTLRIRFDRPLRSRRLGRAWNWSSTWFSAQLLASKISGADVSPEILVSRVYKLDTVSCRCKGKLAFKSLSLTHIWIYIYILIYIYMLFTSNDVHLKPFNFWECLLTGYVTLTRIVYMFTL